MCLNFYIKTTKIDWILFIEFEFHQVSNFRVRTCIKLDFCSSILCLGSSNTDFPGFFVLDFSRVWVLRVKTRRVFEFRVARSSTSKESTSQNQIGKFLGSNFDQNQILSSQKLFKILILTYFEGPFFYSNELLRLLEFTKIWLFGLFQRVKIWISWKLDLPIFAIISNRPFRFGALYKLISSLKSGFLYQNKLQTRSICGNNYVSSSQIVEITEN